MPDRLSPMCAKCPTLACSPLIGVSEKPSFDKSPNFCPMKLMPEVVERAISEYDKPEVGEFARQASLQEFECYEQLPDGRRTKNPRIIELIQFAQKCGRYPEGKNRDKARGKDWRPREMGVYVQPNYPGRGDECRER